MDWASARGAEDQARGQALLAPPRARTLAGEKAGIGSDRPAAAMVVVAASMAEGSTSMLGAAAVRAAASGAAADERSGLTPAVNAEATPRAPRSRARRSCIVFDLGGDRSWADALIYDWAVVSGGEGVSVCPCFLGKASLRSALLGLRCTSRVHREEQLLTLPGMLEPCSV